MNKYIHYGCTSTSFDVAKVNKIRNREGFSKPLGGFWASAVDSEFGCKEWCESESYGNPSKENSFEFSLKDDTNVLKITSVDDLTTLPKQTDPASIMMRITGMIALDFEKLSEIYDAIEVSISSDVRLYQALYGWDCDSIVIINPEIIVPM